MGCKQFLQRIRKKILPATYAVLALIFCYDTSIAQQPDKGLKDYYANYFSIGVAVAPRSLSGEEAELIKKHFASITAENVMKPALIHPEENKYFWDNADKVAAFAKEHGLKIRGHTLCWHNQTGNWFFKDEKGNQVTKDVLLRRLKEHITAVVSRYKGKIYAWDVVNEVIDDNNTVFYRNSLWYQICGEDYIIKAFEYAHAADPDAKLFYNDYNTENPAKREKIYQLVKKLKDAGVPIHGVGLQGHWSIYEPTEEELRKSIELFSSLGLDVQITELDVSVYRGENGRREKRQDESDVLTPEQEQKQIEQYAMIFRVLRDYKDKISAVTFWNVSDKHSWLDNFPVRGRKNYPLLFDQELRPKKAYWEVVKF